MKHDRLAAMFNMQRDLMKKLGVSNGTQYSSIFSKEAFEAAIGMVSESAEVLDVMNRSSKPWKALGTEETLERFNDEVADVLFFTLEVLILVHGGKAEDVIVAQFANKQKVVRERIKKVKEKDESNPAVKK